MNYGFGRISFHKLKFSSPKFIFLAVTIIFSLFTSFIITLPAYGMGKPTEPPGGGGGGNGGGGNGGGGNGGGGSTTPKDADFDGMDDTWEENNGLDPSDPSDAIGDFDGDFFTNFQEFWMGTDPHASEEPGIVYVDAAGTSSGDGTIENPYNTIQLAINQLSNSPESDPTDKIAILVAPGEYPGNIDSLSKPYVHIVSSEGPTVTTIQGSSISTAVKLQNFITASICGFTIQGGNGGIHLNYTTQGGPGIALIEGNVIKGNTSIANGGGIYVNTADSTRIINNFIIANKASQGGGIFFNAGKVSFWHNTVVKNIATVNGGGLAASATKIKPDVLNNIVWGNSSSGNSPQVYRVNPSFSIIEGGAGGTGNINSNPMFVDETAGNYHICANSPARDAAARVALAYDWDLELRENDFVAGDIGADETVNPVSPHGLKGDYLVGNVFSANTPSDAPQAMTRIDPVINFDWGNAAADEKAPNLSADDFSVRWTGQIEAPVTGDYTFRTLLEVGNTSVRLWIGESIIIDFTQSASNPVQLTGGEKYELKLEYYDDTGEAAVKLFWTKPGEGEEIIPNHFLYSPIPDFRYPLYTPTSTTQGISISSGEKTQIYNEGDLITIINNNIDDTQTEGLRVFSRSGCIYHSRKTPKILELANFPSDHYFVEIESGDRRQFVILPSDYQGANFLGTEAPSTLFRQKLVNAINPGLIRIHTEGQWPVLQPVQPTSTSVLNISKLDGALQRIKTLGNPTPKITISCFGRPGWQNDDAKFLSDYLKYLGDLAEWLKNEGNYSNDDFIFEIWNEPTTITPPFINRQLTDDNSYVEMVHLAHASIPLINPNISFRAHEADNFASSYARIYPSYPINTGGDFRHLQDNGVYALSTVSAVSWHPSSMARWPVDEDSFNEDGVLIHRLDKQGPALRSLGIKNLNEDPIQGAELHVSEMYLWSESALGFPIKLPTDRPQDNLDWITGMNRGVKEVILWRAGGVDLISPHVFIEAFSPGGFDIPENGNDNRNGWDYYFRGPHPKTGAFLMACYWLNGAQFVSSTITETSRIYTFTKTGETFHFAWAKEGQMISRDQSLVGLNATDIFGRPVPANNHSDEVYLFR